MCSSYFKIPNSIFDVGLTTSELAVYTYFLSINRKTHSGIRESIIVKYQKIAKSCGITTATAHSIVSSLTKKGFIIKINRYSQYDGSRRINCYTINHLNGIDNHILTKGYFTLSRKEFSEVITYGKSAFAVYLNIRKCLKKNKAFPPLTSLQQNCNISSRHLVVTCVRKLEKARLIRKRNRYSKKKNNTYIANEHIYIPMVRGVISHVKTIIILKDDGIVTIIFFVFICFIPVKTIDPSVCEYIKFT